MVGGKTGSTRAFIGIDLPDELKEALTLSMDALPKNGLKVVSKNNMHITLFFLGNLSDQKLEDAKSEIEKLDYKKFYSAINGIGTFSMKDPNILFAKIDEGKEELAEIYRLLFDRLKRIGINLDSRPYAPHVTIARVRELVDKEPIIKFVEDNSSREFGRFLCESVKLKQSTLTSSGPIYTDIYARYLE